MFLSRLGLAVALLPSFLLAPPLHAQTTGTACTGLCLQQVQCPNGGSTTISGTVFAPNGTDPIPNVTVYIPNAPVTAFDAGVSCPVPGTPPSGTPLVGTFSAADGTFTLNNVPVGNNIPLVIVAGKWRRQLTVPGTAACTNTVATGVRFPTNQSEGDIPKFLVSTGAYDQVECVLRKVGIADTEFTNVGGSGRVQLMQSRNGPGARIDANTVPAATVLNNSSALNSYDVLMLPCEGVRPTSLNAEPALQLGNLVSYANAGGRVYASHYAYQWMYQNPPFDSVAKWRGTTVGISSGALPATVNQDFGTGITLTKWLSVLYPSAPVGQIDVSETKSDILGLNAPTQPWLSLNSNGDVMQFTWATPVGQATNQCGRVLFNEYHVENPSDQAVGSVNLPFPNECNLPTVTPQEKLLEFSLFDLSNNGGPASLSPGSFDFGDEAVGYTSASQNFTITNNAAFPSALTAASATGDFLVTDNTCRTVAAGGTCTVSVAFQPTALGTRTGTLSLTFAGSPLAAALTGTGVPAFGTSSSSVSFGSLDVGASATQTVQITNQAPGALALPSFSVSGDYRATTNCPASIPTGGTCQLAVTFMPTATGTRAGTITASNGTAISLSGNGVDFAMKATAPADTAIAGLADVNSVTASPIAGFNAAVTLSCTTTAPDATCVLSNGSFTLVNDTTATVTLSTVSQYTLVGYGDASWAGLGVCILSCVGFVLLRRKQTGLARAGLLCAGLWCLATYTTGCSGKIPAQNGVYTKPGTYTVTVQGTDGFLVHAATYQVNVKAN